MVMKIFASKNLNLHYGVNASFQTYTTTLGDVWVEKLA